MCEENQRASVTPFEFVVVLEQFPNWLEKSIAKIRDTNTKLKKISNEKKETKVSLFHNNKEQKMKKPVKDEEVTYGARDCDIGTKF